MLRHRDDDGFTLIELLVVIIIIGILASIAIPTFLGQRQRAYVSALKTDVRNVASNAETFYTDGARYSGFAADALFTTYQFSVGVTVMVAEANTDDYCIWGEHNLLTDPWYFDSDGSPQLNDVSC